MKKENYKAENVGAYVFFKCLQMLHNILQLTPSFENDTIFGRQIIIQLRSDYMRTLHVRASIIIDVHCSDKLKEHVENTSDPSGKKNHALYLYWYGRGNVMGMVGRHIV